MSKNSQWGKMKQSILSSVKKVGSQNNRKLTHYSLQNVQYQETDRNQINKLPTWGILFNKTLTKEDETKIIKIIIISTKWVHESFPPPPRKSDCSSQQKDRQKEKPKGQVVKRVNRASIRKAYILYTGGRRYDNPFFRSSVWQSTTASRLQTQAKLWDF